jgi:DNA-binding TFAR19-related protein (PDSD5 family)
MDRARGGKASGSGHVHFARHRLRPKRKGSQKDDEPVEAIIPADEVKSKRNTEVPALASEREPLNRALARVRGQKTAQPIESYLTTLLRTGTHLGKLNDESINALLAHVGRAEALSCCKTE